MQNKGTVVVRLLTFSTWHDGYWFCGCNIWSCSTSSISSSYSDDRRWQARTGVAAVSIQPTGGELDKAWLIRFDVGVDPGLVTGHSGVDSRQIWPSTAKTETNDSRLNPDGALLVHHWTSWVTLRRRRGNIWDKEKIEHIYQPMTN